MRITSITGAIMIIPLSPRAEGAVACNETHNPCEDLLWKGSRCRDGFCTNPFQGGCLRAILDSEEYNGKYSSDDTGTMESMKSLRRRLLSRPRVCNSEDGSDVVEQGLCVESENEYTEVRIYSQDWESSMVMAWIMQILYSELLGVPSTIESGVANKNANFYDESNRMEYGSSYDASAIENALNAKGGDCTMYKNGVDEQEYAPCAHLVMEIWFDGYDRSVESGAAEALKLVGMVAFQGWHITKFSIKRDPSLSNHFGLSGEENRRKLAETFKRPTTWRDYCTLVSTKNCSVYDGVAKRAPAEDGSEDNKYFSSGLYTGYFRVTEKNDCDANPTTCTGHVLDYPCGWTSYIKQQTWHNKIALESDGNETNGGYTYGELVDIWYAANATKSDVIGLWFSPDATFSTFARSDSALTQVLLPTTSQECLDNRVDMAKRCDPDATEIDLYGDSKGACGENHVTTRKMAVENMQSNINTHANPKSRMSPAYDVYEAFSFTSVEINDIMGDWISRGVDKYGFDLRLATCKWMTENLDHIMKSFVPPSHPRILVPSNNSALTIAAFVFSAIAILLTIGTMGGILFKHQKGSFGRATQIEFLLLLLAGLFMVSVGSLLLAIEPSTGTCVGSIWMINVGYTTQLVPTLIRVSTIIKIVKDSMKMKIVMVDKKKMFRRSIGISGLAAIYCLFWTIFDTPHSENSLEVTGDQNEFGETIVKLSHYCDSDSDVWFYASFTYQAILLLCASALAYEMRQVPNSVNDSKHLAIMIYSSFFFLALRFVMYVVSETLSDDSQLMRAPLQNARSLFCSLDTVANILIFFSRFFVKEIDTTAKKPVNRGSDFFADNIARRGGGLTTMSRSKEPSEGVNSAATFAEDEKVEEKEDFTMEDDGHMSKSTVRIRMKGRSINMPKWVVEEMVEKLVAEYGSEINTDESDD
mmetsp:Transcript_34240/g.102525  ORF Transcript_34240/g.102525 Transcript_34240/m.102525 type:complete len:928 (-) Transcript_34240:190-2973(-)